MSDGLSDGARGAREAEARQKKLDAFFGMVLEHVKGGKPGKKAFREAFDAFEAYRWCDSMARYRLEKERGKRWEKFLATLGQTVGRSQTLQDVYVQQAWAEILSLALRFASSELVENLHDASPFKGYRIALYVPNGSGHWGPRDPTLLGDFAGALDALVGGTYTKEARVVKIDDADRAVVGLRTGGGTSEEVLEPERAQLRFLAVFHKEA